MDEPIARDMQDVSDGFHTFRELYAHRIALFLVLAQLVPARAWKSRLHYDGTMFEGWFIAGINAPGGTITYHLPLNDWDALAVKTYEVAPPWDGHTSADVVARLREWADMLPPSE